MIVIDPQTLEITTTTTTNTTSVDDKIENKIYIYQENTIWEGEQLLDWINKTKIFNNYTDAVAHFNARLESNKQDYKDRFRTDSDHVFINQTTRPVIYASQQLTNHANICYEPKAKSYNTELCIIEAEIKN